MPIDKIQHLSDGRSHWFTNPFIHAKRVYINFLQYLFQEGNPLSLVYNRDPKLTDIMIIEGGIVSVEGLRKKPAIAVTRDTARLVAQSMGSVQDAHLDGTVVKKEHMPFTLIANILALTDRQVEEIAWFVASRTWLHMDFLAAEGFFSLGIDITITAPGSPVSAIEGDPGGYYLSRVILPCRVMVAAQISLVNYNRLKTIISKVLNSDGQEIATIKADDQS